MSMLTSREYKMLLITDAFSEPHKGMNDFWRYFLKKSDELNTALEEYEEPKVKRRWVWFKDTDDHAIRSHNMSLRERRKLKKSGEIDDERKTSLKSRGQELEIACDKLGLLPSQSDGEFVCEQDTILELKDPSSVPSLRTIFAGLGRIEIDNGIQFNTLSQISEIFPALKKIPGQERTISIVNNGFVAHEVKYELGIIKFTTGFEAEASFTLWHRGSLNPVEDFATGPLLLVEFSYKYEIGNHALSDIVDERASTLLKALSSSRWSDTGGMTKTEIAYG